MGHFRALLLAGKLARFHFGHEGRHRFVTSVFPGAVRSGRKVKQASWLVGGRVG